MLHSGSRSLIPVFSKKSKRIKPAQRSNRKAIVLSAVNSKLPLEVRKRIKFMRSIEVFVIFTVRTLDFAIVPGCKGLNELVANAKFLQFHFK